MHFGGEPPQQDIKKKLCIDVVFDNIRSIVPYRPYVQLVVGHQGETKFRLWFFIHDIQWIEGVGGHRINCAVL